MYKILFTVTYSDIDTVRRVQNLWRVVEFPYTFGPDNGKSTSSPAAVRISYGYLFGRTTRARDTARASANYTTTFYALKIMDIAALHDWFSAFFVVFAGPEVERDHPRYRYHRIGGRFLLSIRRR